MVFEFSQTRALKVLQPHARARPARLEISDFLSLSLTTAKYTVLPTTQKHPWVARPLHALLLKQLPTPLYHAIVNLFNNKPFTVSVDTSANQVLLLSSITPTPTVPLARTALVCMFQWFYSLTTLHLSTTHTRLMWPFKNTANAKLGS